MPATPDLLHYHYPEDGSPGKHARPAECCAAAAAKAVEAARAEGRRAAVDAVHTERRRVVLEAIAELGRYRDAVATMVDPAAMETVGKVVTACLDRIRRVGCICPMVDISTLGEARGSRMVAGGDPRCGVHGEPG